MFHPSSTARYRRHLMTRHSRRWPRRSRTLPGWQSCDCSVTEKPAQPETWSPSCPLAQSTVSEHLRILREAGLIQGEIEGPRTRYCINATGLAILKAGIRRDSERVRGALLPRLGRGHGGTVGAAWRPQT